MKLHEARVVKFGGSIVGSGARISKAAQVLASAPTAFTVVIASAPGDLTDRTLGVLSEGSLPTEGIEAARVLARAEQLGAELMASALRARGVPARLLLPGDRDWPVIVQAAGSDSVVDLEETGKRFRRLQARSPEGTVLVLPGFVGVDLEGRSGTLPRGGGDTTAVVAGRSLGARTVFLVKDVPGVLEADPRLLPSARTIPELSVEQMERLARSGAEVVALDALRYLPGGMDLRVIGLGAPLDATSGTVVRASAGPSTDRRSAELPGENLGRSQLRVPKAA